MSVETLIPIEEYLGTSYSPDREYQDGVLVERNVGDKAHANLQALLTIYFGNRRKEWGIKVYTEMRIQVRQRWYRIPDLCVYPLPEPEGQVPSVPPLLWIEILSPADRIVDVWDKAKKLVENGVPYVWIIDPNTLDSELWTSAGLSPVPNKTLRLPDSPIVVPLSEVMDD